MKINIKLTRQKNCTGETKVICSSPKKTLKKKKFDIDFPCRFSKEQKIYGILHISRDKKRKSKIFRFYAAL